MNANINHRTNVRAIRVIGLSFILTMASAAFGAVSDSEVENRIIHQWTINDSVDANDLSVDVNNGVAVLTGDADHYWESQRAERIAAGVLGVLSIDNDIAVDPVIVRSDRQVRRDVSDALLRNPATDLYEVRVRVDDGLVTLNGTVDSHQERDLAESVAYGVLGVDHVDNNLEVDYLEERSDYEIKQDVVEALRWDALVDARLIDVDVDNGSVALSGVVNSLAEKSEAILDAYVLGTESVDASGLIVDPYVDVTEREIIISSPALSEEALETAIMASIALDPLVGDDLVAVDVNGSVATLRGTTDSLMAKQAAEQDARETIGVDSVVNLISVSTDETATETELESDVALQWLRDPFVNRYELEVDVVGSEATIDGRVDTNYERAHAETLAREVVGVTDVINSVEVRDEQSSLVYDPYVYDWYVWDYRWYSPDDAYSDYSTDAAVREAIEDELFWSPFVDEDDITVSVEDGVATLVGTVDSQFEKNTAVANALEGGARYARNRIIVN